MKTLEQHTLLYDEDCPLCNLYTSGFIKTGMLDQEGRKPYASLSINEQHYVDMDRATNEIALLDTKNKTVIYGIDSLLKVVGHRFPIVEKIGQLKLIKAALKKLYAFISYNRKVIIPNKPNTSQKLECIPHFNVKYRLLYIVFATIITIMTLFSFSKYITLLPGSSIVREALITIGQFIFQGLFIYQLSKKSILHYFGNLITVSLMGSLLLLPLVLLNGLTAISDIINMLWFSITVLIMYIEHSKRVSYLKLPGYLSYTWIAYRILILITLIFFNL